LKEYVSGEVFKEYTSSFPLDIYENIVSETGNSVGDYVINYKGDKYVLICIEENAIEEEEEKPQDNNKEESGGGGTTVILFALGGIGALGGAFLIMKMRKKVRAA